MNQLRCRILLSVGVSLPPSTEWHSGGPKPPPTSITTFLHHIVTYRQRKHQAIDPILLFLPLSLLLLRTYVSTQFCAEYGAISQCQCSCFRERRCPQASGRTKHDPQPAARTAQAGLLYVKSWAFTQCAIHPPSSARDIVQ